MSALRGAKEINMKLRNYPLLAMLLSCSMPHAAFSIQGVPTPYVTKGVSSIATDGFYLKNNGSDQYRSRALISHGFTDQLSFGAIFGFQDSTTYSFGFHDIELVGVYELTEKGKWLVDNGIYAGLLIDKNKHKSANIRYLVTKTLPESQYRLNLMLSNELDKPIENAQPEIRARAVYNVTDSIMFGAEYFGKWPAFAKLHGTDGSRQLAGPIVTYTMKLGKKPVSIEAMTLSGLNNSSPDFLWKWCIGVAF